MGSARVRPTAWAHLTSQEVGGYSLPFLSETKIWFPLLENSSTMSSMFSSPAPAAGPWPSARAIEGRERKGRPRVCQQEWGLGVFGLLRRSRGGRARLTDYRSCVRRHGELVPFVRSLLRSLPLSLSRRVANRRLCFVALSLAQRRRASKTFL